MENQIVKEIKTFKDGEYLVFDDGRQKRLNPELESLFEKQIKHIRETSFLPKISVDSRWESYDLF